MGFDGNKKIKGFKQQIVVDTMGFLYGIYLHAANLFDSTQGIYAVNNVSEKTLKKVKIIIADKGYRKTFIEDCEKLNLKVFISGIDLPKKNETKTKGFNLDPTRWIVERTIAWICQSRRLIVNFEKTFSSQSAFIWLTMLHLGIKKLIT